MTLVEVLLAMVILSSALMLYVDVLARGNTVSRKADAEQIATQVAMDKMTSLQQNAYSNLTTDSQTTTAVSGLPGGQMTVKIGALDGNAANTNIRQIDITVTWSSAQATPEAGGQVALTGLVSATR